MKITRKNRIDIEIDINDIIEKFGLKIDVEFVSFDRENNVLKIICGHHDNYFYNMVRMRKKQWVC